MKDTFLAKLNTTSAKLSIVRSRRNVLAIRSDDYLQPGTVASVLQDL